MRRKNINPLRISYLVNAVPDFLNLICEINQTIDPQKLAEHIDITHPNTATRLCKKHKTYHAYSTTEAEKHIKSVSRKIWYTIQGVHGLNTPKKELQKMYEEANQKLEEQLHSIINKDKKNFQNFRKEMKQKIDAEKRLAEKETHLNIPTHQLTTEQLLEFYTCYRKISYITEKAATTSRENLGHHDLQCYICVHCTGYHLGHTPAKNIKETLKSAKERYLNDPSKANEYAHIIRTH